MKINKKLRKSDVYFLTIIVLLLTIIGGIYLFDGIKTKQAEIASYREIERSIEESQKLESEIIAAQEKAINEARAMRPSSSLTLEDIAKIDNTDNEFWFIPGAPYAKERPTPVDSITHELGKYDEIWLGEDNQKVFLTMDLGYEYNDNVTKILDIAKKHDVKINFFLTGEFISTEPEKVKRMYEEGHLVGNHTVSHHRAPELLERSTEEYEAELKDLEKDFTELTGGHMAPYIRPPYGAFSERTLAMNQFLGYYTVFWSFAYFDWDTSDQLDPEIALDNVLSQLHNGEIFLLHTISNTNVEILDDFFKEVKNQGYEFKRLDERNL